MGDRKLILADSDLEVCATIMAEFDSQQTYINELNRSLMLCLLFCVGLCCSGHSCLRYQAWISITQFSEDLLPVSDAYDPFQSILARNVRYMKQFWIKYHAV